MTSIKDNQNTVKARIQKVVAQYIAEKLAYYVWLQTGETGCDKNMKTAKLIQTWCLKRGNLLAAFIPMSDIVSRIENYCDRTNICSQFDWSTQDVENFFNQAHEQDMVAAKEVIEKSAPHVVALYLISHPNLL
ncbi:MAG: hypothetical protein WCG84_03915 [Candidatus Moraniibacteriota bacterium]